MPKLKDFNLYNKNVDSSREVYRVIDDGECILTTMSAVKALKALMALIEKHDVTVCWADVEILDNEKERR